MILSHTSMEIYTKFETLPLSKSNTVLIKGLFVIIVFCSHYLQYVSLPSNVWNDSFVRTIRFIGQLMVAPFFFYSGYGIFISLREKGEKYVRRFLSERFIPIWLYFVFCVGLYYIAGLIRGKHFDIKTIMYALVGWKSIGNSNWFMFVTFSLYILFILAFYQVDKVGILKTLCFFTGMCMVLTVILAYRLKPWWYNTLMCFPAGMWVGYKKEWLDIRFRKHYFIGFICAIATLCRHRL